MMDITKLLTAERNIIDGMFKQNNIYAKVDPSKSVYGDPTSGFIRYALKLRQDQRFDAVEKIHRELSVILSDKRDRARLSSPIQVIPVSTPSFALEVPHPAPQTLLWSPRKVTTTPAHTMLIGRSYAGKESHEETISLADSASCHVLVVGITGAGKSVLLQSMMLSLTANTSPDDLKLVLVDLKNEDMLPFRNLPHVLTFAGSREQAVDAIKFVYDEKEKRVANEGYKPYRLVLWIDEMAQLASMKGVADMLGDLASIGRGKLINLVGATQHPTDRGGLGGLLKANFPVRLVGMVASGQSYIATNRPKIHADLLPGKGAFLRIQGPTVQRFQSYNIEANDVRLMADYVGRNWNNGVEPPVTNASPMPSQRHEVTPKRDEIDTLADRILALGIENKSKNYISKQLFDLVYGGRHAKKIDDALARISSSASSSETSSVPSSAQPYTSESESYAMGRRSDEKIIKFPRRAANY